MSKIRVHVSTGYVGSKRESVIEMEDWEDMGDEEREEAMREEMFNMIEWGYEEVAE